MEQGLSRAAGGDVSLTFVPHLAPMTRGIHATLFATLTEPSTNVRDLFESRFADEPFVRLTGGHYEPETRHVRGTNVCEIDVTQPPGDTVVITVAIDNLIKGASGQAVQAMNLMQGWDETTGLMAPAVNPNDNGLRRLQDRRNARQRCKAAKASCGLGGAACHVGGRYLRLGYQQGFDDRVPLVLDEAGLKDTISKLETRLAVDSETLNRFRTELADSEKQVDELEKELVFYRDIMSSSEDVSAVKLRHPISAGTPRSGALSIVASFSDSHPVPNFTEVD